MNNGLKDDETILRRILLQRYYKIIKIKMVDGEQVTRVAMMDGAQMLVEEANGRKTQGKKRTQEAAGGETPTQSLMHGRQVKIRHCLHPELLCKAGMHQAKLLSHLAIHLHLRLLHHRLSPPRWYRK
jgi:hypothetical protein